MLATGEGRPLNYYNNPKSEKTCEECGDEFSGTTLTKYCDLCRVIVDKRHGEVASTQYYRRKNDEL